jgi:DNA-binding response OmpR family regulator
MKPSATILIADRNRHVRELLKREMAAEGYRIRLAKNGQEVLNGLADRERLDLLILDPDLPGLNELHIMEDLRNGTLALPIIIHTYVRDFLDGRKVFTAAATVEKNGHNINRLKQAVVEALFGTKV